MSPEEVIDGARVRRRSNPEETGVVIGWRVNGVAEGYTFELPVQVGENEMDLVAVRLEPPVPDGKGGHTIRYGSTITEWELCPSA